MKTREEVVSLMRSKIRCLNRILSLSQSFLSSANEVSVIRIARLENERAQLLRAVDHFDRKLTDTLSLLDPSERDSSLVDQAKAHEAERFAVTTQILKLDNSLLSLIEEAQSKVVQELTQSKRSRETLGKFKSVQSSPSGESLDQRL